MRSLHDETEQHSEGYMKVAFANGGRVLLFSIVIYSFL